MQYFLYAHIFFSIAAIIYSFILGARIKGLIFCLIAFCLSYWLLKNNLILYFVFGFAYAFIYTVNIITSGSFKSKEKFLFDLFDIIAAFVFVSFGVLFWSQVILSSTFIQLKLKNKNIS